MNDGKWSANVGFLFVRLPVGRSGMMSGLPTMVSGIWGWTVVWSKWHRGSHSCERRDFYDFVIFNGTLKAKYRWFLVPHWFCGFPFLVLFSKQAEGLVGGHTFGPTLQFVHSMEMKLRRFSWRLVPRFVMSHRTGHGDSERKPTNSTGGDYLTTLCRLAITICYQCLQNHGDGDVFKCFDG